MSFKSILHKLLKLMSIYIPSTSIGATEAWCYTQFPTFNVVANDLAGFMPITGGTFSGGVTFNANPIIGSSISLLPSVTNNANLGSSLKYFNNAYINNLFVNNEVVASTTVNNNPLIELNASDTANANIGTIFDVDASHWSGMFKDGTTGIYKFLDGLTSKPTSSTSLPTGNGVLQCNTVQANTLNSSSTLFLLSSGITALTLDTSQNATFAGTVKSGNLTLTGSNLNSTSSLILGTSGNTSLTLDTSQNATFAGTVKSGNLTLTSSNLNSSGSLIFGTSGSTTALTINSSQNANFVGNINVSNIFSNSSLVLGSGGSNQVLVLDTSLGATFSGNITGSNSTILSNIKSSTLGRGYSTTSWGTAGPLLHISPQGIVMNDSSAAGTVTNVAMASSDATQLTATNSRTFTNAATFWIGGAPFTGTNVTITNPYALVTTDLSNNKVFTVGGTAGSLEVNVNNGAITALSHVINGSTSGTITHNTGATVTSHTLTWPTAVAASSGYMLSSSSSGSLSWISPYTGIRALFQNTSAQTIPNNTTTSVQFPTSTLNSGGLITASGTSNTTFTNVSGSTVYVLVTYYLQWVTGINNNTKITTDVILNATTLYGSVNIITNSTTIPFTSQSSVLIVMNNNDNIVVQAFQNNGTGVQVGNNTSILSIIQIS